MSKIGHNSEAVAGDQVRSFVERLERLNEDKDSIQEDIKEVYAEAKGRGFDVKILRKVVQRRKMDHEKRLEQDELLALYEGVFG